MRIQIALGLIIAISSFYGGYKLADNQIIKSNVKTEEKVVIEEKNKTTTIYRKIKDKSKTPAPNPPKKYRMNVLIDPTRPDNYQIGAGYRLIGEVFLEGTVRPSEGEVLIGIGIMF